MTDTNLIGLAHSDLQVFFATLGEKPYRASQLMKWIYHQGVTDFSEMSNLSKGLRERLESSATIKLPKLVSTQPSDDGTIKWLLALADGNCIEAVFIPETERGTLCVSSQVGCALNCSFCSTATQGFSRNLTADEIVGQVLFATLELGIAKNRGSRIITNIVLMGMGEPLLNFENVTKAVDIMLDDNGFGVSKRRVTLSTAGLVPAIDKLRETQDVSLAVSLHAPNDALRNQLVPINKKYPLHQLLAACQRYVAGKVHRRITMEYVMLKDINDLDTHAYELAQVLKDVPSKVNLIPFNSFPGADFQCSDTKRMEKFRNILIKAGFPTIIRKTRGGDIAAACGQLVGQVNDRTRRQAQWKLELDRKKGITV